jgi:flagellar motor switch protein FliM
VVFSLDGKSGPNSVLQLPPQLALAYLDHALGGPGGAQPQRELTDIELIINRGMVVRALESINYAFASVAPLTPRIDGLLQDPQLLQIARAADMVLLASFEIPLGALTETATLVTPLGPLAKALSDAATRDHRSLEEIARAKEAARLVSIGLANVPVDVAFTLSPTIAAPNQMLRLSVGDVIRLHHPAAVPLNVTVGGAPLRRAVVTSIGNRRACLIVDPEETTQ